MTYLKPPGFTKRVFNPIAAYREKAGKTVDTYWKQLPDASDHPVFRLEPA